MVLLTSFKGNMALKNTSVFYYADLDELSVASLGDLTITIT